MVWRNAARLIFAAGEALSKAFAKAIREEIRASQQAAASQAQQTGASSSQAKAAGQANARLGITLQEAMQILNVRHPLNAREVEERYQHLFAINDKKRGGSLYLQSKVYRAKERIDEELNSSRDGSDIQEAEVVNKEEINEQRKITEEEKEK
ncbi:hypothetical protein AB6A40_001313 [Gnathostoma spinigerum]|uniref:Mitochondrial import inner membrane translocase subunit tim-16 n=1 Tax=Gnathostoma spinigerum TaxID=75299 RepID=A0ABD6E8X1_9BILA